MNRYYQYIALLPLTATILIACSNKKETPETIASKWCKLNSEVSKAAEGEAKQKARQARTEFENAMETKYKEDTAMMNAIFKAVETCEGASKEKGDKAVTATDLEAVLPLAYGNAKAAADVYCSLIDKSIAAARNNSDAELNKIMSAKLIFEKNMDESYKDNPGRRDSIFRLIEPCMAREVKFRSQ